MLALRIALRYLFSRKSHNAVNIISSISVAGVAVATSAIVCVLSVFNGFTRLASGRLGLIDPDIKIESKTPGGLIDNLSQTLPLVEGLNGVAAAVPLVEGQALSMFRNTQQAVEVIGAGAGYERVCGIDSAVIDGVYMSYTAENVPLASLSVGSAITLGVRPGFDVPIVLFTPRRIGRISASSPLSAFRSDTLFVSSVWQTNQAELDEATVIVPVESARSLLQLPDSSATAIAVKVAPGVSVSATVRALKQQLGGNYRVLTRIEQEEASFRMIEIEKWITFLMLGFILVIASFNVVSTLSMLIIEKRYDMDTLCNLGARPSIVGRIFLWEGWLITLAGGVAGIILGAVLCFAQQKGEFIKLNADPTQLTIAAYPVELHPADIAAVMALLVVVGLAVGAIASRIASRK